VPTSPGSSVLSAGTYLPASSSSTAAVTSCPPGYYCPNDLTSPNYCYSWYVCTASPVGLYDNPIPCPLGSGSPAGSIAATDCGPCLAAPGYYCPGGTSRSGILCPAGYYCVGGTATMVACTAANVLPNYYCPEGSSADVGSLCLAGYQCLGNSNPNDPCPEGSYSYAGTRCTRGGCPTGKYLPAISPSPAGVTCTNGSLCTGFISNKNSYMWESGIEYFGSFSSTNCIRQNCPPGAFCTGGVASYCAAGKYSAVANSVVGAAGCPGTCVSTVLGSWCGPGAIETFGVKCDTGYYGATLGLTAGNCSGPCTVPAGHYCPAGSTNATNARICPAGWSCAGGSNVPSACPQGKYSYAGSSTCTNCACAPGNYCSEGSTLPSGYTCPQGYYCTGGTAYVVSCSSCANGRYCPQGSSSALCDLVAEGSYVVYGAKYSCNSFYGEYCPEGSYSNVYSSGGPLIDCPAGYCECGTQPSRVSFGSLSPPPPTHTHTLPDSFSSDCTGAIHYPCGVGYYSEVRNTACSACTCAPGSYCPALSTTTGGISCPAGYSCAGVTANKVVCTAGTFSALGDATCTLAPVGRYSASSASSTTTPCTSASGFYCPPGSNNTVGVICPPMYACAGGSAPNVLCVYPQVPDASRTVCGPCPATPGNYCDATGLVVPCTEGNFCGVGGTAQPTPCTSNVGTYCPPGQSASVNTPCPPGSRCPGGGSVHIPCPEGSFAAGTGNSVCSSCTLPPPGSYCPAESQQNYVGVLCTPGSSCPGGGYARQPCAPGYSASASGASACTGCPAGSYATAQSTTCSPCLAFGGSYCPALTTTQWGVSCPAGRSCAGLQAQPVACPIGHYSAGGQISCSKCPSGVYGSSTGLTTSACTAPCTLTPTLYCPVASTSNTLVSCPEGYACPATTTATATMCEPGTYAPAGSSNCKLCPAGRYGGFYALTNSTCSGKCQLPPGFYCAPGSTGPLDATPCPLGGFVCLGNGNVPTVCAVGEYQDATTGACTFCPAGVYGGSIGLSTASCSGPCTAPPGRYCPSGSKTATGLLCPSGKTCAGGVAQPV